MKPEIFTIDVNDPIKNAAKMMNTIGISCLLVVSEGLAVGIITERDIMKSLMFNIVNLPETPMRARN